MGLIFHGTVIPFTIVGIVIVCMQLLPDSDDLHRPKTKNSSHKKGGTTGGGGEAAADDSLTAPPPAPSIEKAAFQLVKHLRTGNFDESRHMSGIWAIAGINASDPELPLHDFSNNPTLQRVHNNLQIAFLDASARADEPTTIPMFGTLCTDTDFSLMLNLFSYIDTGVKRFFVTFNSPNRRGRLILLALHMAFPDQVLIRLNDANQGVSASWNNILRASFEAPKLVNQPFDDYAIIANADVVPLPTQLARFAANCHQRRDEIVTNRFAHFAFFAVTLYGYVELGGFDETIFPAYGEDVEYHVRAVSKGLGSERGPFAKFGSNNNGQTYLHFESPNRRFNARFAHMANRFPMEEYLQQKWGISMGNTVDFQTSSPFPFPFNNQLIWHAKSFLIDPAQRQCVIEGRNNNPDSDDKCPYDLQITQQLQQYDSPPRYQAPARIQDMVTILKVKGQWVDLGAEGHTIERNVSGIDDSESLAAAVRFGADQWSSPKNITVEVGGPDVLCRDGLFGGDPAPLTPKTCEVWDGEKWKFIAGEGWNLTPRGGPATPKPNKKLKNKNKKKPPMATTTPPPVTASADEDDANNGTGTSTSTPVVVVQETPLPPPAPPTGAMLPLESRTLLLRFGIGRWVTKIIKKPTFSCTMEYFRVDPAPGASKRCHVYVPEGTPAPSSSSAATETS